MFAATSSSQYLRFISYVPPSCLLRWFWRTLAGDNAIVRKSWPGLSSMHPLLFPPRTCCCLVPITNTPHLRFLFGRGTTKRFFNFSPIFLDNGRDVYASVLGSVTLTRQYPTWHLPSHWSSITRWRTVCLQLAWAQSGGKPTSYPLAWPTPVLPRHVS